jgi:hypothetical protein
MRTLPRTGRSRPGPGRVARRAHAAALLLGVTVGGVGLVSAPADPLKASRWMYRATLRARGGSFVPDPGALLQSYPTDCGPAALATLLTAMGGDPPDLNRIRRLAGTGARGTTFAGLSRAARVLGMPNRLRRLDPASLVDQSSPVIAWVDRGHYVTLVPDFSDTVLVRDPLAGSYRISVARLRRFWSGEALVPEPRPTWGPAPTTISGSGGTP